MHGPPDMVPMHMEVLVLTKNVTARPASWASWGIVTLLRGLQFYNPIANTQV